MTPFTHFRRERQGVSIVGYALLLGLIAIFAIAAIQGVGGNISSLFGAVSTQMEEAHPGAGSVPDEENEEEESQEPDPELDPPPILSNVLPDSGLNNTATTVLLTGSNFVTSGTTTVTFGGIEASNIDVDSTTEIFVDTPDTISNTTVDIVITNPDGQNVTLVDGFTFITPPPPFPATFISAGNQHHHTCALTTGGAAMCWGQGTWGKLGHGETSDSLIPVQVDHPDMLSNVQMIRPGQNFTCAITAAGAAMCWGVGSVGRLGNGDTQDSLVPVQVSGLTSGVQDIASGASHSCAVTSAGAAVCWGSANSGRLGNGITSNTTFSTPVQVTGLTSGVQAIDVSGWAHSCAIVSGGAVMCWGLNSIGQLGTGNTNSPEAEPVQVSGLTSGAQDISVGDGHGCVVTAAGAAMCWGRGVSGQLGNGGTSDSLVPVSVNNLTSGVQAIAAGVSHSCAINSAGAAMCWGAGGSGQLGNGSTSGTFPEPVQVSGLTSGVQGITTGHSHSCAVTAGGTAMCWGHGGNGRLGNNGIAHSNPLPVDVWSEAP